MKVFYIADITGKVGVWAVKKTIADIKRIYQPHIIIAHANKTTGTGGLGKQHAAYLHKMGIDCIVGGDCIFQKQDLVAELPQFPFVLRPCNLPAQSPGTGFRLFHTKAGVPIGIISLLGRVGHYKLLADNPFTTVQTLFSTVSKETPYIIVDFSSSATAEKQTMAFFLAGKVSAVIGSGAGAATADCQISNGAQGAIVAIEGTPAEQSILSVDKTYDSCRRTGYITDTGRTGSFDSVGGYAPACKIREYRTGLFEYPQETWRHVRLQGLVLDFDNTGSTRAIEQISIEVPSASEIDK